MKHIKTKFIDFVNESMETLNTWKDLMDKYDLKYYKLSNEISKDDIRPMRISFMELRRLALDKLNAELEKSGKKGSLMQVDVSDDELYPYLDKNQQFNFFKYSRVLDFIDGYKPKNLIMIKKNESNTEDEINTASELYAKYGEEYPYACDAIAYFIFGDKENSVGYAINGKYGKNTEIDGSELSSIILQYEYSWETDIDYINTTVKEFPTKDGETLSTYY